MRFEIVDSRVPKADAKAQVAGRTLAEKPAHGPYTVSVSLQVRAGVDEGARGMLANMCTWKAFCVLPEASQGSCSSVQSCMVTCDKQR